MDGDSPSQHSSRSGESTPSKQNRQQNVSSTPGSLYSQASAATQATPLVAGTQPQATPQVVVVNGTPLVAGTPMVRGTPRSPFPRGNPMNSPYLSQSSSRSQSTPISVSMRGDVGKRASRVVNLPRNVPTFPTASGVASNARNEPSTPVNWHSHSNTGTPYNGGDSSQSQFSGSFTPSGSQENTFPIPTQQSAIDSLEAVEAGTEEGVYIWGTNIMTQEAAKHFKYFLNGFIIGDDFEPYYVQQMEVMHRTGKFVLNVDCRHLHDFVSTRKLYRQLIDYPQDMFQILDTVVMNEYEAIYGHYDNHPTITVRVYGLPNASAMRNLDPGDIERLVAIKGMIIRVSPVIPDLIQAFFRCYVCADTVEVVLNKGRIDEPNSCPSCQRLGSMQMIHNRSTYGDKQLIRMQETPDEVPEGETPYTVSLYAFGDLVDSVRPGDRVEVTGVFRAIPRRTNPRQRSIASVYKTYVDCIHMRRVDVSADESSPSAAQSRSNISSSTDAMAASIQAVDPTAEDQNDVGFRKFSAEKIEMFHEFARSGDIYGKLVKSFAPSIFEMDDVKRGVLCLLFGGTLPEARVRSKRRRQILERRAREASRDAESDTFAQQSHGSGRLNDDINMILGETNDYDNEFNDENDDGNGQVNGGSTGGKHRKMRQRGDINILLCGDPGTSKSQMLSYVHKITPRGIYTSGKGSSAVGLTASVVRDPETRDMVLESGALVLSDNGICCIDEFDKMSDATRSILHEAMEQQTVSITKAGIIATLNARASILASANPVQSRYNPRMSVVENIKLPPTLLSRFDLIYLILDKPDPDSDRRLANHLVSLYYPDDVRAAMRQHAEVDQSFLKDYIAYARAHIAPEISSEAIEVLVQGYLQMRSMGGQGGKTISATPRQLESLIRLSQALAKMRLSEVVLRGDVDEAIRLMRVATQTAATDPRTGTIDMDMITTGKSALDRDLILKLTEQLRTMLSLKQGQRLTVSQLRQTLMKEAGISNNGYSTGDASLNIGVLEVEEAVKELESEGILQYIPRTQTAIIRTGQGNMQF